MDEYRFVRLSEHNLQDLVILYADAFKKSISLAFLLKKYDTAMFGPMYIGYLAYAPDGTPAAYYGVFPCKVRFRGKDHLCAQSGDTMTHSTHRGKQLFTQLAKATYQLAEEQGIEFVFGFPNKNSYPGFVKNLQWTCHEKMNKYELHTTTIPLNAAAKRFAFLRPFYNLYLHCMLVFFKKENGCFENTTLTEHTVAIPHDTAFFEYKKYTRNYVVHIGGIKVWVCFDGSLMIGDMEKNDRIDLPVLLKKLKQFAVLTGTTKTVLHFSKNTYWDERLASVLAAESDMYWGYVNFTSGLPLDRLKFCLADADTF